jgi:hypothetical protein
MGSMKDLFGDKLYSLPLVRAEQLSRRDDPDTSFQAGQSILVKLPVLQEEVLRVLRLAGKDGFTDWELEQKLGSHGSTYRSRRSELVAAGLVVDSGRKRVNVGKTKRIVWVAEEFY